MGNIFGSNHEAECGTEFKIPSCAMKVPETTLKIEYVNEGVENGNKPNISRGVTVMKNAVNNTSDVNNSVNVNNTDASAEKKEIVGGSNLKDFRPRNRNKHDVFDMIREIEEKHGMVGGADDSSTTEKTEHVYDHIEALMLESKNDKNYNENGNDNDEMVGGCACGATPIKGGEKHDAKHKDDKKEENRKAKKHKKKRRKFYEDSSNTTSASESSDSSAKLDNSETSSTSDDESSSDAIMYYENGEKKGYSEEGALHIFPFNSSDMTSSVKSGRNQKLYKRRG